MEQIYRPKIKDNTAKPGILGDVFSIGNQNENVTICHGHHSESLPVADMTVGQIRERFSDRLDIDPASQAILDGNEVTDDEVLKHGQVLTFIKRAGEKGVYNWGGIYA